MNHFCGKRDLPFDLWHFLWSNASLDTEKEYLQDQNKLWKKTAESTLSQFNICNVLSKFLLRNLQAMSNW